MSEKFVSPHPLPSDHERELLTILIEECAEVRQRATKMLRFGRDEVQPGQDFTNADRLAKEIGDLVVMVELAVQAGLVRQGVIDARKARKLAKPAIYMQTGGDRE